MANWQEYNDGVDRLREAIDFAESQLPIEDDEHQLGSLSADALEAVITDTTVRFTVRYCTGQRSFRCCLNTEYFFRRKVFVLGW